MVKRLIFILIVTFSLNSYAKKAKTVEELIAEAKVEFDNKNYSEAISLLKLAYEKEHMPRLLFNIARAYEELGDIKNAIMYFEIFSANVKDENDKIAADKKVKELKEKEVREKQLEEEKELIVQKEQKKLEPEEKISEEVKISRPLNMWQWIAIGSGIAIAGVGAIFHLSAFSHYNNAKDADPDEMKEYDSYFNGEYGKAKDYQKIAVTMYAVGAAAVTTGVLLFLLDKHDNDKSAKIFLTPYLGNESALIYGGIKF